MRRHRVLLDANVLVDAQLRDLFLTMAEAELIDLRWSQATLDEVGRALVGRLQHDEEKVGRLLAAMTKAFPEASVLGFEALIEQIEMPDPDDRHVLAAATQGECDFLVTFNEKDFPHDADVLGDIRVLTPDEAVLLLAGLFPDRIASVVAAQIGRLRRPATTAEGFLNRLAKRVPTGAVALGVAMGVETYERIFEDIVLSASSTSAQHAVKQLVWAIQDRDLPALGVLIDPTFAVQLVDRQAPSIEDVHEVLHEALRDLFSTEGWGVATARRPHAPDVELVKLVRMRDEPLDQPLIVSKPTLVQAHLFSMRLTRDQWVLVGLDGPDPAFEERRRLRVQAKLGSGNDLGELLEGPEPSE